MHRFAVAAIEGGRKASPWPLGRRPFAEALALIALVGLARLTPGLAGQLVSVAAACAQLMWPLSPSRVGAPPRPFGPALSRAFGRRRVAAELAVAAGVCALTLPPWALGAVLLLGRPQPGAAALALASPWLWLDTALAAAAEEWFWRGHVQVRLGRGRRALVGTSALFAACHWAHTGSPVALSTFVPSCIFGALAGRRRHLLAASACHAAYNLASVAMLAR